MAMHTVNNLAEGYGCGVKVTKSFDEIITPKSTEKRTAEEIINNIASKLNGAHNEFI